jgi:hypothetical protein
VEEYRVEQKVACSKDSKAKLSSGELLASTEGRLQPMAKLGSELLQVVVSMFKALWPGQVVPGDIRTLLQWISLISNRVEVLKESAARAGAKQALSFVLSWYPGVNLDQLEHLREGGLVGLDEGKLRQRACAIVECTNSSEFFDAGDNESLDGVEFDESSPAKAPEKASEGPVDNFVPPSPSGDDFVLAARTGDTVPEPADSPIAP